MPSGMDLIDAIRNEQADPPSGIKTLGLDQTHRWLTEVKPGRATFVWQVDDRHLNLEGVVICSWTIALADQAVFFAATTLCTEGETTRMGELHFRAIQNIRGGTVTVDARVRERRGDRMHCDCDFVLPDGSLAASASATLDVIR